MFYERDIFKQLNTMPAHISLSAIRIGGHLRQLRIRISLKGT
jgi:hypothetical protein